MAQLEGEESEHGLYLLPPAPGWFPQRSRGLCAYLVFAFVFMTTHFLLLLTWDLEHVTSWSLKFLFTNHAVNNSISQRFVLRIKRVIVGKESGTYLEGSSSDEKPWPGLAGAAELGAASELFHGERG